MKCTGKMPSKIVNPEGSKHLVGVSRSAGPPGTAAVLSGTPSGVAGSLAVAYRQGNDLPALGLCRTVW